MIAQAATLVLLGTAAFLTYQTPEEAAKVVSPDQSSHFVLLSERILGWDVTRNELPRVRLRT